ncbi:MBL fold metallo-hydrolase [Flavobacterium sp.]|uniref:MBL fold metallo-hydrolase n=1 Tax=Flavobacterium sp. TaxID=239 RepID=UPI0039E2830E
MYFLIAIASLTLIVYLFMLQPVFGRQPSGERLERIQKSPHYKDGSFQNLSPTPSLAEGHSLYSVMKKFLFEKKERNKPIDSLPSQKTNLLHLNPWEDVLVWFGHSSYFMQIDGKKILVDPVLSGAASPIKMTTRSYTGSDVYTPDDFPEIDYLFISHDHYDHLDYETVVALKSKIKRIITGLGTGEHFERWGFPQSQIIEKDWYEKVDLGDGFEVNLVPTRHFSGRGFSRNKALWTAFAFKTPTKNIYIGGDSGYDTHFAQTGEKFGPFDLAILECGQYDEAWKYIHTLPNEIVPAAKDLKAKALMPVHWGKFSLANHAWDESISKVAEFAKAENLPLVTPMIGEKVNLNSTKIYEGWWKVLQ